MCACMSDDRIESLLIYSLFTGTLETTKSTIISPSFFSLHPHIRI